MVLRGVFDPAPLSEEVDLAFAEGFRPGHEGHVISLGTGTVRFRYLPMMCDRTPVSLACWTGSPPSPPNCSATSAPRTGQGDSVLRGYRVAP